MKRIAVCLSGQIRTWKKVIDTWNKIVCLDDVQIDYFIHMWNETSIPIVGLTQREIELINLTDKEIMSVINTIKPISYKLESQKIFLTTLKNEGYYNPYECQYYSMYKSCQLKTQHEIDNNFKYDIVVKSRFDLFFNQNIIDNVDVNSNSIYAYSPAYDENDVLNRVTDIFFYSDSDTFNKLSNYYNEIDRLPKEYKSWDIAPEFVWFYYITNSNINIEVNHWDIKVMRNNMDEIKNKNFDYEIIG